MNKNIKNIMKEKITSINLFKKNIIMKIIKSVSQNNNINNNIKIYSNFLKSKNLKRNATISKKHKICLYTGKRSGILKSFDFSRYRVKNLVLENKFTNLKKNNF
jgi:ribosomal protein S14